MFNNNINTLLDGVKNKKARNVKLGYGSFITIDFGKDIDIKLTVKGKTKIIKRGEWHLWVYECDWGVYHNNQIIASSEDSEDKINKALLEIENKALISYELVSDTFGLTLIFEGDIFLKLLAADEEDAEQWFLYTPDKKVFTAGPGKSFTYENSGNS